MINLNNLNIFKILYRDLISNEMKSIFSLQNTQYNKRDENKGGKFETNGNLKTSFLREQSSELADNWACSRKVRRPSEQGITQEVGCTRVGRVVVVVVAAAADGGCYCCVDRGIGGAEVGGGQRGQWGRWTIDVASEGGMRSQRNFERGSQGVLAGAYVFSSGAVWLGAIVQEGSQ